jgi:hypothetical protein
MNVPAAAAGGVADVKLEAWRFEGRACEGRKKDEGARPRNLNSVSALVISSLLLASSARGDEVASAGRKALKQYENSVLTIKLVLNQSMAFGGRQGHKQEERSEVTGTVIGEKGLIVVSLAATDPAGTMGNVMSAMGDEGQKIKMGSEISDIKILLPGGREVPGRVVLRDKDLDLAFVVPSESNGEKWTPVDLEKSSRPAVLDEAIVLNRLGQVAGRSPSASVGRITAVIEKPRTYYVIDHDLGSLALGSPVFGVDGNLVGLMAIRTSPLQGRMGIGAMFSGASAMGIIPVIVPAEQIREAAAQVPKEPAKPAP